MNDTIIRNHNSIVTNVDTVIHVGDFSLISNRKRVLSIVDQLNGIHIFLRGSHDYWIPVKNSIQLLEIVYRDIFIVACHYCMLRWPRSHYNSWYVFGHNHGSITVDYKAHDVGVDNNDFYPVSINQLITIMSNKIDNPDYEMLQKEKMERSYLSM